MPDKRRPTMTDVAKHIGVSQTTVSFVLNNVDSANISEETKSRVWEAVETLGYLKGSSRLKFKGERSHTIAFVSDEIGTSPFAGDTLKGAQDAAWDSDKMLILVNTGGIREVEEAAIRSLLERQVEGIVYAAMFTRKVNPPAILRGLPTVLMNCYMEDSVFSNVIPDEVGGGFSATKELLRAGHQQIALINGEKWMDATRDRLAGYQQALDTEGIAFSADFVRFGNWRPDSGYEHTIELMRQPNPPTAIFCANDLVALGAYEALKELGKRIPDDVAVIGYDNQEQFTVYMRPALSTMALPHYEMGQWAVRHLLDRIEQDNQLPIVEEKLVCPFIERESIFNGTKL